jgi:hypothetical protein
MPHWLIKSAIHRAISLLPQSQKWNEWFQEHMTKSLDLSPGAFEARLNACRSCLENYFENNPGKEGFSAFELGTGWYPTVPIGFYLCGASKVWCFDIDPLLRASRLKVLLQFFCEYDRSGALKKHLPWVKPDRIQRLHEIMAAADTESPENLLQKLNIQVMVRDAQVTGLEVETIDLFFSYSVLEYIPYGILESIFKEFKRIARKDAVMVHYIDLWDQYSSFDKSITRINFLKFTNKQWNWLKSPLIPLTRLRISEYRTATTNSGFKMLKEVNSSAPAADLNTLKLAPEFERFSKEDLLVTTSWMFSKLA